MTISNALLIAPSIPIVFPPFFPLRHGVSSNFYWTSAKAPTPADEVSLIR
jgi:hypothetical protein